ncbi:MAG: hypothetical protein R6V85_12690 [Polyangia bacterium]
MIEVDEKQILVGVKADQSLCDAVREAVDGSESDDEVIELSPIGRKDWVAGRRVTNALTFGELDALVGDVLRRLLALDSKQRIRRENVRAYAVPPPVPVFKDPDEAGEIDSPPAEPRGEEPVSAPISDEAFGGGVEVCPVCGRNVHSYNLQYDLQGRPVGCFMCGGEPSGRS